MNASWLFLLFHTHNPHSLISFFVSTYGIPAVSTLKLVNNLSECKHSTFLLFRPVRLKQFNLGPPYFHKGNKAITECSERNGQLFIRPHPLMLTNF